MAHVGHAHQQSRSGAHALIKFRQRPPRVDQVFQYIGHDSQVVVRPGCLLQTDLERDVPNPVELRNGLCRRLGVRFKSVTAPSQPGIQQLPTEPSTGAADIQCYLVIAVGPQKIHQFLSVGGEVGGTHNPACSSQAVKHCRPRSSASTA